MASTCTLCIQQQKTNAPAVWCLECEEILCQPCTDHHKLLKFTKKHTVIPYEDYTKLPSFILNTKLYCAQHGEKFTEFCRFHDEPICITCLKESHRKCEDIPKIDDVVHNVKDSVLFEDTISEMENMCRKLKEVSSDQDKNIKQLDSMHQKIKIDFNKQIDKLIIRLNKLRENTIRDIDSVYNEVADDLSNTLQKIQLKEKELNTILKQKDDIKRLASNYQTFIAIKEMEKILQGIETNLKELYEDEKLMEYDLKFDKNETIEDFIRGVKTLGDITVIKCPSSESTFITKQTKAQKEVPVQIKTQRLVELQREIKLKSEGSPYRGCCTLPSGLMVIGCSGGCDNTYCKVSIYRPDGSLKSIIKFEQKEGAWDVTMVDDHHVAVSHPDAHKISILNVDNKIVMKILHSGGRVTGLCCRGRDLMCCAVGLGLMGINLDSGRRYTVRIDESVVWLSSIKSFNNILCYTSTGTDKLTVLDGHFNVVFIYKDPIVLKEPTSLAIDDSGCIYVIGHGFNNLVVISPECRSGRQLLGRNDRLWWPTALHYDNYTKKLILVNQDGFALVYSIK